MGLRSLIQGEIRFGDVGFDSILWSTASDRGQPMEANPGQQRSVTRSASLAPPTRSLLGCVDTYRVTGGNGESDHGAVISGGLSEAGCEAAELLEH